MASTGLGSDFLTSLRWTVVSEDAGEVQDLPVTLVGDAACHAGEVQSLGGEDPL